MQIAVPPLDPVQMTRDFQANYVNVRNIMLAGTGVPAGTTVMTPTQMAIGKMSLPPALTQAMADYQASHPEVTSLTPVKYLRTLNGNPDLVIEDDQPLPPEDQMVTFGLTVSTLSIKLANVVTHVLVATTTASAGDAGPQLA